MGASRRQSVFPSYTRPQCAESNIHKVKVSGSDLSPPVLEPGLLDGAAQTSQKGGLPLPGQGQGRTGGAGTRSSLSRGGGAEAGALNPLHCHLAQFVDKTHLQRCGRGQSCSLEPGRRSASRTCGGQLSLIGFARVSCLGVYNGLKSDLSN